MEMDMAELRVNSRLHQVDPRVGVATKVLERGVTPKMMDRLLEVGVASRVLMTKRDSFLKRGMA